MEEEGQCGVQHDVAIEIFMGLVQHPTIVAGVNVIPPAVFRGIDVQLWHAHHAHLLVVPVALHPADPMAAWDSAQPHNGRTKPQVDRAALVGGHHGLFNAAIDHRIRLRRGLDSLWDLRREKAAAGRQVALGEAEEAHAETKDKSASL